MNAGRTRRTSETGQKLKLPVIVAALVAAAGLVTAPALAERAAPESASIAPETRPCGPGVAGPCFPRGVAVDAAGNVYVADYSGHRVLEYDSPNAPGGDMVADRVFGQPDFDALAPCASFRERSLCGPVDVALDAAGNLYVADYDGARVVIYESPLTGDTAADGSILADAVRSNRLIVHAPWWAVFTQEAAGAAFGEPWFRVTGEVVRVDDGIGSATDGCEAPFRNAAALEGRIALIDGGTCPYAWKIKNAELAGAIGAIVVDDAPATTAMGGRGASIRIGSVRIGLAEGARLEAALGSGLEVTIGNDWDDRAAFSRPWSITVDRAGRLRVSSRSEGALFSSDPGPSETLAPSVQALRVTRCKPAQPCCNANGTVVAAGDFKVCRPSTDQCDAADICDGTSGDCPADLVRKFGASCNYNGQPCDQPDKCDGISKVCPANTIKPIGAVCRPAGACDVAEVCDGVSTSCPADVVAPAGQVCRILPDEICVQFSTSGCERWLNTSCDATEYCDGFSGMCPADVKKPDGTVCRASAASCDVAEVCDGESLFCPQDDYTGVCVP